MAPNSPHHIFYLVIQTKSWPLTVLIIFLSCNPNQIIAPNSPRYILYLVIQTKSWPLIVLIKSLICNPNQIKALTVLIIFLGRSILMLSHKMLDRWLSMLFF